MDRHGYYSTFEDWDERTNDDTSDQPGGDAGRFEEQSRRLIEIIEDAGSFDWLDDGFVYYFPEPQRGCLSAWSLRAIADELDRRNKEHEEEIEEYFSTQSKEEEDERESRERFDD